MLKAGANSPASNFLSAVVKRLFAPQDDKNIKRTKKQH
jgi:hypothetical protein